MRKRRDLGYARRGMWAYRVIRRFLRFAVGVFFRQIEVVGREHIPDEREGPVLFAGSKPPSPAAGT